MGKTDYGKHDIEHGVCTMDGTAHKFLLEYMQYGYALIAYRKQDGSFYMGRGTLVSYESDFKKKHDMTSIKAHVAYWDAEQQGWRTFLIENFMEWRPIVN